MIKKKCNAYKLIKEDIAKLALVQQATAFSPKRLVDLYLNNLNQFKPDTISDNTAYKYFRRESASYLKEHGSSSSYGTMLKAIQNNYLTKRYFNSDFYELEVTYRLFEAPIKQFVREAFIAIHPITPDMRPSEKAIRNQKLGKITVHHWIGDITNYEYFQQAPGFMMKNAQQAIFAIEMFIVNLLNDPLLDAELMKLAANQNLQAKLQPQNSPKAKIIKI